MPTRLNQFIINCSASWWKFLIIFVGQTGTMQVLMRITNEFPAVAAGAQPFDMQNGLTATQIFEQLAGYEERAFELYAMFQAVDYFFPLFAGLLLATVCAFALRHVSDRWYEFAVTRNLFLLLLVPTVFDWLENLTLLAVVNAWPDRLEFVAQLAVLAKMGKLGTMVLAFVLTAVLLIAAAGRWTGRKTGIIKT